MLSSNRYGFATAGLACRRNNSFLKSDKTKEEELYRIKFRALAVVQ